MKGSNKSNKKDTLNVTLVTQTISNNPENISNESENISNESENISNNPETISDLLAKYKKTRDGQPKSPGVIHRSTVRQGVVNKAKELLYEQSIQKHQWVHGAESSEYLSSPSSDYDILTDQKTQSNIEHTSSESKKHNSDLHKKQLSTRLVKQTLKGRLNREQNLKKSKYSSASDSKQNSKTEMQNSAAKLQLKIIMQQKEMVAKTAALAKNTTILSNISDTLQQIKSISKCKEFLGERNFNKLQVATDLANQAVKSNIRLATQKCDKRAAEQKNKSNKKGWQCTIY